jgi:hypothetical protein
MLMWWHREIFGSCMWRSLCLCKWCISENFLIYCELKACDNNDFLYK